MAVTMRMTFAVRMRLCLAIAAGGRVGLQVLVVRHVDGFFRIAGIGQPGATTGSSPYTAHGVSQDTGMKIGDLSTASSTPVETIRYYERQGLLPAPGRTQGNFRVYEAPHLERLQFIRYCRSLDMSLDEVRVLLRSKDAPGEDCGDVNALLDEHIGHVSRRIKELRALEKQLKELRQRCVDVRPSDQCGILTGLSEASHEPAAAPKEPTHLRSVHR